MRRPFALLILATSILAPYPAAAQPRHVNVDLEPHEITVGGHVRVELTLVWDGEPPEAAPRFPDWQEGRWGDAEVLDAGGVAAVNGLAGRRIYSQSLTLTAFETGEIELPSRTVSVSVAGETLEIPTRGGARFSVRSVLPEAALARVGDAAAIEPKPEAPLRPLPGHRRFLWTAAALVTLCGAAALFMTYRLRTALPEPEPDELAPPPIPAPLDELLDALREIDTGAGSEPAHTAMSLALRRYLGRVLGFHALESTTREIDDTLRHRLAWDELAAGASRLLRDCDEVKYGRFEVGEEAIAERRTSAADLGREIDRNLRRVEFAAALEETGEEMDRETAAGAAAP